MSNKKEEKINECNEQKEVEKEIIEEKQEEIKVETKTKKQKEKKGLFNNNDKKVEELTTKVAQLQEALLRNQAELQNYKRRKEEEMAKIWKYKDEELIKEFLNVLDNFERAIKMDDNDLSGEISKFLSGFKLIYGNMTNILEKYEVKEITAEGVEFDANFHHAVLTDHDETKPEGVVLEVLQKGYIYKDRVIRPAMVKVNE